MKPLYGDWKTTMPSECLQPGELIDRETMFHFRENAGNQNDSIIQLSEVADIVGKTPLYDTIYRNNRFEPWQYAGQCKPMERANQNPMLAPIIYICSRYRADTKEELAVNIEVAKWASRRMAAQGMIPIAPHLYFPRFMDDSIPAERYFGMGAGKRFMELCNSFCIVTVDGNISEGMDEEITYMTETLLLQGIRIKLTGQDTERIMKDRLER